MLAHHLVMMVKAPEAGRVKTRLARGVGTVAALRFYRGATAALSRRISADGRWRTWLAISPERALRHTVWPPHVARRGQGRGDLGERMQHVFDSLPPGPAVIVGSDIPGIRPRHIAHAFHLLGRNDVVLGPAVDGGYWLIGLRRRPHVPRILDRVRWSHAETLADTVENADRRGYAVGYVDPLDDIDEAADLAAADGSTARVVLPAADPARDTP